MKRRLRTPRVVKIAIACVAVFFAVSLIHLQMQITGRQQQLSRLKDEVAQQQETNDALHPASSYRTEQVTNLNGGKNKGYGSRCWSNF